MKRIPLHIQIFVAMALGAVIGLTLNALGSNGVVERDLVLRVGAVGEWMGRVFLTLLQMIVVPLIFASLVSSITSVGNRGGLGRIGGRVLLYYLCTSLLAISVGVLLVNVIRPGDGLDYALLMEATRGELETREITPPSVGATADQGAWAVLFDIVYRMIPKNIVQASSSNGSILAVIFFAIVFALSIVRTPGEGAELLSKFFGAVYGVMITLTNGILYTAPYGIFGYVLFVSASTGLELVSGLAWYMLTVFLALCIHSMITVPLILLVFGRRNPLEYAGQMKEALLTAFSTASSAGTLPLTMKCARDKGGVSERVTSFTLPLGATVNMDGTALYEAVAVLFVSQMLGDLTIGQQVVVVVTALLVSVGAAGIPHAGTVMMVIIMAAVGLPTDSVLVILAVDRVLDMCRTTVNVWGDAVGAAVVQRFEDAADASSRSYD